MVLSEFSRTVCMQGWGEVGWWWWWWLKQIPIRAAGSVGAVPVLTVLRHPKSNTRCHWSTWPRLMTHKSCMLFAFRIIIKSTQITDNRVNDKSTFFHRPCLCIQFLTTFFYIVSTTRPSTGDWLSIEKSEKKSFYSVCKIYTHANSKETSSLTALLVYKKISWSCWVKYSILKNIFLHNINL